MTSDTLQTALLVAFAVLLASAGIEDARRREIANWKSAALLVLAPAWWWASGTGWSIAAWQLAMAGVVFALFLLAWQLRAIGGGDVKLIGAVAPWFPLAPLVEVLQVMALVGGAIALALYVEHRWRRAEGRPELPYGVAIAAAAMLVMHQSNLNHFW